MTFLLFLLWLQLFTSNTRLRPLGFGAFWQEPSPLPPYLLSPIHKGTPESLGDLGEKVRVKAFSSGLSLANGLWPVLGQRRAEHGGDFLSWGSAIKHWYLWKPSLRSWVGVQLGWPPVMWKMPKFPQCLELNDLCLSELCWLSRATAAGGWEHSTWCRKTSPRGGFESGVQCQMWLDSKGGTYSSLDMGDHSEVSTWNSSAKDAVECHVSVHPVIWDD